MLRQVIMEQGHVLEVTVKKPTVPPLLHSHWVALENAEKRLYTGEHGAHAYTDVVPNDGDAVLNGLWDTASTGVESIEGDQISPERFNALVAMRVAQAFAVVNFGVEFLLK